MGYIGTVGINRLTYDLYNYTIEFVNLVLNKYKEPIQVVLKMFTWRNGSF